jgi:hypothetical protein
MRTGDRTSDKWKVVGSTSTLATAYHQLNTPAHDRSICRGSQLYGVARPLSESLPRSVAIHKVGDETLAGRAPHIEARQRLARGAGRVGV